MGIFKYINIPVFIISLAIGLFFVYIYQAEKRVISVYPRPDNIDYIQYKDATGACFKAKQESVKCSADAVNIPVQNKTGVN
jgi:hypothetical protein